MGTCDAGTGTDVGIDPGAAGTEAGICVGICAGIDAGIDAPTDGGPDAGMEVGIDAGTDAECVPGMAAPTPAGSELAVAGIGVDTEEDIGAGIGVETELPGVAEPEVEPGGGDATRPIPELEAGKNADFWAKL